MPTSTGNPTALYLWFWSSISILTSVFSIMSSLILFRASLLIWWFIASWILPWVWIYFTSRVPLVSVEVFEVTMSVRYPAVSKAFRFFISKLSSLRRSVLSARDIEIARGSPSGMQTINSATAICSFSKSWVKEKADKIGVPATKMSISQNEKKQINANAAETLAYFSI